MNVFDTLEEIDSKEVDLSDMSRSNLEQDQMAASEARYPQGEGRFSHLAQPFHNARKPTYWLKAEKPEHRFICFLAAQGFTPIEIAREHGFTSAMVQYVIKQPWAQEFIASAMADAGGQGVEAVLKTSAMNAALGMDDLLERAKEAKLLEVERKVRKDMQDRWFGTAAQVVQHVQVDPSTITDEELAKLATQGKAN